ncbi:putative tail fiber protein [Pseudomonas phage MR16]|nr:putative internal virion protein [Pseudomonas phage MR8]QJD55050.1 putative internal virion protein [Pseudomonas phage MR12]QJD55353.1 putative tail fiber protein [Pseudomonas phage MR18]QJF74617.1 putative tail fiber protein [Pseudomonas phage MR16]
MAQTPVVEDNYIGDGVNRVFALNWPYLSPVEVFVSVNGVNVPYAWLSGSASTVQTTVAPALGAEVRVYRDTRAVNVLHKFAAGVPFLPRYVDENNTQLLYAVQEGYTYSNAANVLAKQALEQSTTALGNAAVALAQSNTAILDSAAASADADEALGLATGVDAKASAALENSSQALTLALEAMEAVEDAGVASFNGRAGIVLPQAGDYTAAMIGYGGISVADRLDSLGLVSDNHESRIVDLEAYASTVVVGIANMRALDFAKHKFIMLAGYTTLGDVNSMYYYDPADTTTADDGGSCIVSSTGQRAKLNHNGSVTTAQFGCRDIVKHPGFSNHVNLDKWYKYLCATGSSGIISTFRHWLNADVVWDLSLVQTNGIRISGNQPVGAVLELAAGKTFSMYGTSPNSHVFYPVFEYFNVRGSFDGVFARLGRDDFSDAINVPTYNTVSFNNSSLVAAAETLRINFVLQASGKLIANGGGSGRPQSTAPKSLGTAMVIRQLHFSNLIIAAGNADKGLYFTGGDIHDNNFPILDIEEVNYGIICDTPKMTVNTIVNGTIVAYNAVNFSQGARNVFDNVGRTIYVSATGVANGVDMVSTVGCYFNDPGAHVLTPAMAGSTVQTTNTTGYKILVNIGGGTVTAVNIIGSDGVTRGVPIGAYANLSIFLQPNDKIAVTYSATPSWSWTALQ